MPLDLEAGRADVNTPGWGISANHLAPGVSPGQFEPQRVSNFLLLIMPPALVNYGGAQGRSAQQVLALSVVDFPMPEETTNRIELHYGNEVRYVAGKTTYSEEMLHVVDYVDEPVAEILYGWRRLVYNPGETARSGAFSFLPAGGVGYASQYKRDGIIQWRDPQGQLSRSWKLIGLWPDKIRFGSGDMSKSDKNVIDITFSVDRIVSDVSWSTSAGV